MAFAVLCKYVSLKVQLIFLYIFKYVPTSCLYQFTLYIIYYICIINNNNKYSNNTNSNNNNIYMYIYYIRIYIFIFHFVPFSTYHFQVLNTRSKKKKFANCPVFLFIYFKMQDFLTDISSLIVFLFAKQINKLFSCFLEVS